MTMMKPTDRRPTVPGRILQRHYLEPRDITISAFAGAVDVSRKHMSEIVNGHARIEPDLAARMAKVLGTTTDLWINLQAAVDAFDATLASKSWKPKKTFTKVPRGGLVAAE
jgi:addiction module HigA family antidote